MKYTVALDNEVDFGPASTVAEILQNVRTIVNTRVGSAPLARNFGITWEHVDKPLPVAKSVMQSVIIDAIETFEPRVKVEAVTFTGEGMDGILKPVVIISIKEG